MTIEIQDVLKDAIQEALSNTHTNILAKITKVNATTIDAQPVINRTISGESVELPSFIELPIINIQGGSSYITMPISVGDYCILFISERCIDNWYYGQDFTTPAEVRMHDYSDAIALVGINPKNTALAIPTKIKIKGDSVQDGNSIVDGNLIVNGDLTFNGKLIVNGKLTVNDDVTVTGNITSGGDITSGGVGTFASVVTGSVATGGISGPAGAPLSALVVDEVTINGVNMSTHKHGYTDDGVLLYTGSPV